MSPHKAPRLRACRSFVLAQSARMTNTQPRAEARMLASSCHPEPSERSLRLCLRRNRCRHGVADRLEPDEFELLFRIVRNFFKCALVTRREQHGLDPGAKRCQHFLLDAAH